MQNGKEDSDDKEDSNSFIPLNDWTPKDGLLNEKGFNHFLNRFFKNAFLRTGYILNRVEIRFLASPRETHHKGKVRIALISPTIFGPRYENKPVRTAAQEKYFNKQQLLFLQPVNSRRRLFLPHKKEGRGKRKYSIKNWTKARIFELDKALEYSPDIICSPEFAVPQPSEKKDTLGYPLPPHSGNAFFEFFNSVTKTIFDFSDGQRQNQLYAPFVCTGSYHCPQEHYNKAVIFPIGGMANSTSVRIVRQKIGRPLIETYENVLLPTFHRKMHPARRMGEQARVPANNDFLTYEVLGLSIAVLICSDILDLNQTLNLARLSSLRNERRGIDFVILPSYNIGDSFLTFCQELSFLASTTVIFVNANPDYDEFPNSTIYICGYPLSKIDEISGEYKDLVKIFFNESIKHPSKKDGRAQLKIIDVDQSLLSALYIEMKGLAKKHFEIAEEKTPGNVGEIRNM